LGVSEPTESPETWAERAGLSLCSEPGVTAARVVWIGPQPGETRTAPEAGITAAATAASTSEAEPVSDAERVPDLVVPLGPRGRPSGEVHLWPAPGVRWSTGLIASVSALDGVGHAWQAWASMVAERASLAGRLERVVRAHRERVAGEEPRLRQAK